MKSKLSLLTTLFLLLVTVSASGGQKFGPDVEVDTSTYFNIQNYFLSPFPLTDYNFLGGGAKARGMGGAFFAVSDDPSAASWNPAGLSQLDKPQMNVSFSSYMHRKENATSFHSSSWNYSYGTKLKYDDNSISFASAAIPFKIRGKELVGGVLYQRLADIYQENKYAMLLDSALYRSDTLRNYVLPSINEKLTGNLNQISISLGGRIFKTLSLGAGVNIYTGKFDSNTDFFAPVGGGRFPYVDTTGLYGYRFHPDIKSEYSGFNLTFGAMYKWDKLRLGGVVKTPFTLKEENDVKLFTDIIEAGVLLESASRLSSPFFKTDRKWKMPTMIGFGGSYQMNALTVTTDIEFRNYAKTELTYRRSIADPTDVEVTTGGYLTDKWWGLEENTPPFVPSLGWRNLTQFRIGGEYVINTKYGKVPLRAGFRNDPKLFTDQLNSGEIYIRMDKYILGSDTVYNTTLVQSNYGVEKGSWVNGNIFTIGTGIGWSQIKLDIAYEYAKYGDVKKQVSTGRIPYDRNNRKLLQPLELKTFSQEETNNHYSRIMISFTGFF